MEMVRRARPLDARPTPTVAPGGWAFLGDGSDLTDMLGVVALQHSLVGEVGGEPVESRGRKLPSNGGRLSGRLR